MIRILMCFCALMITLLPAVAAKRVALVIGNSAYQYVAELPNPKNDAVAISASLGRLGFEVITGIDVNHNDFIKVIRKFSKAIRGADVALLFYAGHGLQVEGRNYLAPVETQLLDEDDLEFETVRLEMVMKMMEREPRTNLVFLDACRNNPLSRNLARSMGTRAAGMGRGLATIESGIGTLIAFATQPGNVALDGDTKHSPFTEALIKHIETPGEDIAVVLRRVRAQVIKTTNGKQVPWSNSSLTGSVILKEEPKEEPKPDHLAEIAFWNSIKESKEQTVFEAYLATYPNGIFSKLAIARIEVIVRRREEIRHAMEATLEAKKNAQAKQREENIARLEEKERAKVVAIKEAMLADERSKQRASREAELVAERDLSLKRKLALDEAENLRAELEKRLAQLENLKKKQPSQNQIKIARLEQPGIETEVKPTNTIIENKELARQIQKELNRIGCSAGRPDGIWGKGSRRALKTYEKFSKIKLVSLEPSTNLYDQLKAQQSRICPLVCKDGSKVVGGKCKKLENANLQRSQDSDNKKVSTPKSSSNIKRPNAKDYSKTIWRRLGKSTTKSTNTKYGKLTCTSSNRRGSRRCRWN